MFTRCPACETTFRLGAEDLRRAQGRVRCGECATVFNALAYLAEEPEAAAGPENWLPEPANDTLSPDEDSVLPAAEPANEEDPYDLELDTVGLADSEDDPFDTAIFVTEPDEDGAYYQTRAFGTGTQPLASVAGQPGATTEAATPFAAATDRAADPIDPDQLGDTKQEDTDSTAEFLLLADIEDDLDAEASSTDRWSQALQQHELAETGLDLTLANRSDFLSEEELNEAANENDALTVSQPVLQAEPDTSTIPGEEDFDDTIWERIPGVGAADDSTGRPIEIAPLRSPWKEEPRELPQAPLTTPASADTDDSELLEFNAPEETWSRIFVSGTSTTPDDEDDTFPELYADDNEDNPEAFREAGLDNEDDEVDATGARDDMAQLERIFNPERIAAAMQERMAARAAAMNAPIPAAEDHVTEAAADTPEREEAMAVWLTDEDPEEENEAEPDAFPAEGYDVQHIILADESEPAQGNAAVRGADTGATPLWREQPEPAPARSPLWLTGGVLLVAALAIQLLHYNRDTLAASPVWGNAVATLYRLADMELFPEWSMDNYEIRSAEAVTGESGPDIMDIRAQVAAVGEQPTGYPYLRVVLSDRWSKPVAEKTFGPADYIADGAANGPKLMEPGQTIEAHVSIVDPGAGAQGFELELCLPRRHTGMECNGQPFK